MLSARQVVNVAYGPWYVQTCGSCGSTDTLPPSLPRCCVTSCSFYNLVTDFYEYGWGQSFHFAPRRKNEYFRESIRRAEYVLASRIEVPAVSCRACFGVWGGLCFLFEFP